jgi:hypothetical protein
MQGDDGIRQEAIMSRHQGGEQVKAGFYVNLRSWEVTTVSGEGGTLPGGPDARYRRVPTLALLVFAPLMGALYAIFLPFIGIAMVLQYLGVRAWRLGREAVHAAVAALAPSWHPVTAHFSGTPDEGAAGAGGVPPGEAAGRLASLEREIAEREQQEAGTPKA